MLRKLLNAIAVLALSAQIVAADVELSGFIDMSFLSDDGDKTLSLDQLEVDFSSDLGEGISVRADMNAESANVALEQAYIAYETGSGVGLTLGKFLSCTGFEAAEPTGMYQYSHSATLVYGGYQHGIAAAYGKEKFALYGALVSSVWDGNDTTFDDFGFEAQLTLAPLNGLTAKFALAHEDGLTHATHLESFDRVLINIWASYETGPLTAAVELNSLANWEGADGKFYESGTGYLAMANYGINDKIGITARVSGLTLTDPVIKGRADYEVSEMTVAPSYALSGNWALVAEVKMLTEGEADAVPQIGLESLLTF